MSADNGKELLLNKLQVLSEIERLQKGLPHLHGWKWYPWARSFFESQNRMNLLVAANQLSKSSTNMRKCIHWATETDLWPELWVTQPRQFWYLYPSKTVATVEWKTKWVTEFMPRGEFKNHPKYGWKEFYNQNRTIDSIEFKSGVVVYFKSYEQDVHNLQSGTVAAIFCDEELPVDLFDELTARLTASDGYFHMVFTATRGQEFWKETMEDIGLPTERFPKAWKKCISLYDCLMYEDGSNTPWTLERIERRKAQCRNEKEVLKRVMGRFIKDDDLKFASFSRSKNVRKAPEPIPKDWHIYSGVDIGSGGKEGHPGAIVFVAVRPDYKKARAFKFWRGDGVETTAGDIYAQYCLMKQGLGDVTMQLYDHASKDFFNIASRSGDTFYPAEKGEAGVDTLNTLFAHEMLDIDEDAAEAEKLIYELGVISKLGNKRHAKDDMADACRYACSKIPFNWAGLKPKEAPGKTPKEKTELDLRREWMFQDGFTKPENEIDAEFDEWNELAGN